ncbi:preprocathepsin c precursor, putative [Babesia bigemina]|uniref:Dipeptidyl peptidase 1 n=1 Tax=Babesia bigemina TaxID=5866 RepID=A0A061DB97_BABBI|nr:preprocathepsin c precursor, putative [Babesia bigemina]CDR96184.1 preprocathepsin c precursor, putative [Babesia bigemina]|eukprot:XP_012768370.1 preprocathepsin c precursor, putative [Babesia bigemina]
MPLINQCSDVLGIWRILETETFHDEPQTCGGSLPNRNLDNLKLGDYRRYLQARYGGLRETVVELVDERHYRRSELPPRNQWRYLGVRDPASGHGFIGQWTLVYDEGLDIDIGPSRYFGFFKYVKIDNNDCPMVLEGSQEDSHGNVQCYRTTASEIGIGWATRKVFKNGKPAFTYGCFYAEKVKDDKRHSYVLDESSNAVLRNEKHSINKWVKRDYAEFRDLSPFRFLQLHKGTYFKSIHHSHLSEYRTSDTHFANRFMQKGAHGKYACKAVADAADYYGEMELPRHWSWGDSFSGETDIIQPFSQGQCGSCYAMASIYVLARRFDILLRKLYPETNWEHTARPSVRDIVECSPFNQGCFGGFPFLVGKHLTELGVLSESDSPYTMKLEGGTSSCHVKQDSPDDRWFAASYGYIGGCYECTSELEIMKEVYHHGPVAVAIDAPQSLFNYYNGVYDDEPANHGSNCDLPLSSLNGWEYTNHAIIIVGWGEEDVEGVLTKFWVCRNTWGNDWGIGGFFKMKRGVNLCGVESQAVYIDPDLTRGIAARLVKSQT